MSLATTASAVSRFASRPPDPWDPGLGDPYDHSAFYVEGDPYVEEHAFDHDTGLRCGCGREVVGTLNDSCPTGWAHVGIGDASDATGEDRWKVMNESDLRND